MTVLKNIFFANELSGVSSVGTYIAFEHVRTNEDSMQNQGTGEPTRAGVTQSEKSLIAQSDSMLWV